MRNKVYGIITEKILEAMDKDIVPWRATWKVDGADRNPVSGTEYRGINTLLLSMSRMINGFSTPYWYTFKQASSIGGKVKKGSSSTLITFYNIKEKKQDRWTDAETKIFNKTGKKPKTFMLRYYRVFNLDQIEGIEAPESKDEQKDADPIECCEMVMEGYKNGPKVLFGETTPSYYVTKDTVRMPKIEKFESAEEYYGTMFHELGLSTGHKSRLNRECLLKKKEDNYGKEELVAEMTAAFLCGHCGIEQPVIENQAAYLKGWAKKIKEDKYMVVHAAGAAQKAADLILGKEFITNKLGQP